MDKDNVIRNLELNIRWICDNPAHQFPGWSNVEMAMRDALELLNNAHSIQCASCAHWDTVSGLSARMCDEWQKHTTQREFCSRWRATKGR